MNAKIRNKNGKGASRPLRRANKFPAVIYGGAKQPVAIELDDHVILKIKRKDILYKDLINLSINNEEITVKIQSVQYHPVTEKVAHIDFFRP